MLVNEVTKPKRMVSFCHIFIVVNSNMKVVKHLNALL